MTTDSQDTRSRDGYAAGHRDGSVHSTDEDALQMRSLTGDEWADDGHGAGRHALRSQAFASVGRVLKDVLWLPDITRWLRRLAGIRGAQS